MSWRSIDPTRLSSVEIFASLSEEELRAVARLIHVKTYKRNELIIAEGSEGDELFIIVDGAARVSRTIPGLGEEALAIIGEGAYFGEMALFGDTARSADVYADKKTELWAINIDEFQAFLGQRPRFSTKFLWGVSQTLANRVRAANAKVTFLSAAGKFD